jgi:CheY-like chemotaxis protein
MAASGPLVLVVEDDRGVRSLLETVLASEGFDVAAARDGLEGLLKLRMLEPALIVLDIMMPDVGGLRVLDELAAEHASAPVVVVTGKSDAAAASPERPYGRRRPNVEAGAGWLCVALALEGVEGLLIDELGHFDLVAIHIGLGDEHIALLDVAVLGSPFDNAL